MVILRVGVWPGEWVGGCLKMEIKAISASIEVDVELS